MPEKGPQRNSVCPQHEMSYEQNIKIIAAQVDRDFFAQAAFFRFL